ncbi:hypothetical protein BDZ45DRAFT_767051, partial [Acephala macrosclerotiorum]
LLSCLLGFSLTVTSSKHYPKPSLVDVDTFAQTYLNDYSTFIATVHRSVATSTSQMSQPNFNYSKPAAASCSAISTPAPTPAQLPTVQGDDILILCLEGVQEFFNKLVQESIIFQSDPICGEMVTKPSSSRITDLILTWTLAMNPRLTSDERTIFDRLTASETKKLFVAVAKEARLPLTHYYNMGRKIPKDIGQISETSYEARMKVLRDDEKRANVNGGYENGEEEVVGKKRKRRRKVKGGVKVIDGVDLLTWAGIA